MSTPFFDNDWVAEIAFPAVMQKVILAAGFDPLKQKDVRITQNITVTSGVGTMPSNLVLECLETANVLYAPGAKTWTSISVITNGSTVIVSSAGTTSVNGIYTLRGTSGGKNYYNLVGQADSTTDYVIKWFVGTGQWYMIAASGDGVQYNTTISGDDEPWEATDWSLGVGVAQVPTVSEGTGNSTITIVNHGFTTGQTCRLTTSGTLPGGLSTGVTYYIIVIDVNTIRLATSFTNAKEGTGITLTSVGTGTGTITIQDAREASYVRDYADFIRPLPTLFDYWTINNGSFYFATAGRDLLTSFTGTVPLNAVVYPIISSNVISIVAGTALTENIVDDICLALASAIREEVTLQSQLTV